MQNFQKDFERYLLQNLPHTQSFHPHFNEALAWVLKAGGKHFRAKLVLGVAEAFGSPFLKEAYDIALAVEFLHAYSLIHDDLPAMDNSPLRRGVATLHIKFDETTAILAGDALNTEAFRRISVANLPSEIAVKCVEILATNGGLQGMVIGQAIDCFFENKRLSLEELSFLHSKKTGALIAASMQLGGVLACLSSQTNAKIYDIGVKLGLAFQIHDDLLDSTQDETSVGKPVLHDSNKNSFTNLLGVEEARAKRDELICQMLSEAESDAELKPLFAILQELCEKYLTERK